MSESALSQVRIGIVGPSWWVDYWHLPACQAHPDALIVGVCGERDRADDEVRAKYGQAAEYYTDLDTMLVAARPDGVIVCTPNDLHYPATMAALDHGISVTCEKPVAMNATQARAMADNARERGLIGMTNFPYRGNPAMKRFRELVTGGAVGEPICVSGCYHGGFGLQRRPGWRGMWSRSGAGILGDLGSHLIDLARFGVAQEFVAVCGHGVTLLRTDPGDANPRVVRAGCAEAGNDNDDSFSFLAEFASGAQGVFHTSWVSYQGAATQYQELEVTGTVGRVRFQSTYRGSLLQLMPAGSPRWETLDVPGTMAPDRADRDEEDYFRPGRHTPDNTTYRFIQAIRDRERVVTPGLEDGWRAQQVIDAALRSNIDGCWAAVE